MMGVDNQPIPFEIQLSRRWVPWNNDDGGDKKKPIDPEDLESDDGINWKDESNHMIFGRAYDHYRAHDDVDGVGYVLTDDDPFIAIDLDDCRDPETGEIDDWVEDLIDRFDSFTEVSPSGTGVHIWVKGDMPGDENCGDFEMYESRRYITVTGEHVDGTPQTIHQRQEVIESAYDEFIEDSESSAGTHQNATAGPTIGSKSSLDPKVTGPGNSLSDPQVLSEAKSAENGDYFEDLWEGDWEKHTHRWKKKTHSEADEALCTLLAFWTGGDRSQMDRLFRRSGLMREKWNEIHYGGEYSYGCQTISRAISFQKRLGDFYQTSVDVEYIPTSEGIVTDGGEKIVSAQMVSKVMDVLTSHDPIRTTEVASKIDYHRDSERQIRRALDRLAGWGHVRYERDGRKGYWVTTE